mgnify:CR=1 FL=1
MRARLSGAGPASSGPTAADEGGSQVAAPLDLYNKPKSVDDIINHTVGRMLDLFGIETKLVKRWEGGPTED